MVKRFSFLDIFVKPSEDARVRTNSGATLTIFSFLLVVWLFWGEIRAYYQVVMEPALVVDNTRNERMDIYLDITFPNLPCKMLSLDAVDVSGEIQDHMDKDLKRQDLDHNGNDLDPSIRQRQVQEQDAAIRPRLDNPDYEGPCYGAKDEGKCLTCDEIRHAYAQKNWKFHDGSGFQQCVEEKYPEHLRENSQNGCRMSGKVSVSKVVGSLHFAPGESFFHSGRHSHDLSGYNLVDYPFSFSHHINDFSFGQGSFENPMAGVSYENSEKNHVYRYFTKVVATEFIYLNGTRLETNQYAATRHDRSLQGGRDGDHPNTIHQVGGMPGIWITYDISPMKVINIERRRQTLSGLILNMCATLGAVITSAAVVDRGVYEIDQALRDKKTR